MQAAQARHSQLMLLCSALSTLKAALTDAFHTYISREQVQPQLRAGTDASTMDLKLSTLKTHVPEFVYAGWKRCADDRQLVRAGWEKCGFLQACETKFQVEALDLHSKGELFPSAGADSTPHGSEGEGSSPGSDSEGEVDSEDDDDGDACAIEGIQLSTMPY